MIVISDTSPFIALLNINKIEILHILYGKIITPNGVREELKSKIGFRLHPSLIEKVKLMVGE